MNTDIQHSGGMSAYFSSLFKLAKVRPNYGQGIRGFLGLFIFLAVGILTDQVALGFQAGFMAWIVSFVDDYIALGRRVGGAAVVAVIGAVTTFLGTIAGNWVIWSVVATVGIGFAMGLLGVLGPSGTKKSLVIMFLTLFAVGFPGSVTVAGQLAVATIVGGLGGVLIILMSLPLDPRRSERNLVATQLDEIARQADALARGESEDQLNEIRTSLIQAVMLANANARFTLSIGGRNELTQVYVAALAVQRDAMAFHDAQAISGNQNPNLHRSVNEAISDAVSAEASRIRTSRVRTTNITGVHELQPAIDILEQAQAELQDLPPQQRAGQGALRSLSSSLRQLRNIGGRQQAPTRPSRLNSNPWAVVKTSLRHDTTLRRHLFRWAILVGTATFMYKVLEIPDGFFIPMGINIMLQPYLGVGVFRVQVFSAGTILGSAIGAGFGVWLGDWPMALALVASISFALCATYFAVTYWSFAVGISVAIITGLGLLIPGGWDLAFWRVADTLIAAVFVTLGLLLLWPTKGRLKVPMDFGRFIKHNAEFLSLVVDGSNHAEIKRHWELLIVEDLTVAIQMENYKSEPRSSAKLAATHQKMLTTARQIRGAITSLSLEPHFADEPETAKLADQVVLELIEIGTAFTSEESKRRQPSPSKDFDLSGAGDSDRAALLAIGAAGQSLLPYVSAN